MKTLPKTLLLSGILGITGLTVSCKTAMVDAANAVTCDKCKTVWVQRPAQSGVGRSSGYYSLAATKSMTCPDCRSAVSTFFATGQLKHTCTHCGGAMTHCTTH